MKITNLLPDWLDCINRWHARPGELVVRTEYEKALYPQLRPMLDDFVGLRGRAFSGAIGDIDDWAAYRRQGLALEPTQEEARVRRAMTQVESLLGRKLDGEAILFGAFGLMDGYARFDRGKHQVFLGVDVDFHNGPYLDILIAHELTHVIRESIEHVWTGWGIPPRLPHDEFVERQPALEHLFAEGFSCAVSELIHPGHPADQYVYQSPESLELVLSHARAIDRRIHAAIEDPGFSYRNFYDPTGYARGVELPYYAHYVWSWAWVRSLLQRHTAADLAGVCSREYLSNALEFSLERALLSPR